MRAGTTTIPAPSRSYCAGFYAAAVSEAKNADEKLMPRLADAKNGPENQPPRSPSTPGTPFGVPGVDSGACEFGYKSAWVDLYAFHPQ